MDTIEFLVQGSAPKPYNVVFRKKSNNLSATCTCAAGEVGQYCKHRIRIINGDATGIVSANVAAVAEVKNWVKGTGVERSFHELAAAEEQLDAAKKRVFALKKKLARTLLDG